MGKTSNLIEVYPICITLALRKFEGNVLRRCDQKESISL